MATKAKGKTPAAASAAPDRDAIRATFEAQRSELVEALRAGGLGARVAEIEPLIRDTIAVTMLAPSKAAIPAGTSRLGGAPDLPAGAAWPEVEGQPLPFLAQLRLEEVAPYDVHGKLPGEGLLSLFAGRQLDADGVPVPRCRVLRFPAGETLTPAKPPMKPMKPCRIELAPRAMLPPCGSRLLKFDAAYQRVWEAQREARGEAPEHGILCFDRPYEEALAPEEEILLRLDQAPYVPYDFVEAAVVYVILGRAALAARDWDAARASEGSSI